MGELNDSHAGQALNHTNKEGSNRSTSIHPGVGTCILNKTERALQLLCFLLFISLVVCFLHFSTRLDDT